LLDAGTIGTKLERREQQRIRHVLLTHLHLDHIRALPTLADNLAGEFEAPLTILGIDAVARGLRDHIFNDHVYPDFFRIPDPVRPVLQWRGLALNQPHDLGDLRITPVLVNHTVPAIGCIISDAHGAIVFSGDTGPTEDLWRIARDVPNLRAIFIECSYPDAMEDLAFRSKHLTPSLLAREVGKIGRAEVPVYPYHLKPMFASRIDEELRRLRLPGYRRIMEGDRLTFS
jgi:ribonuclease BN (tRNA processing enzyme)